MGMKGAPLKLYTCMLYNVSMHEEIRTNHTVAYRCHYHVVWCPKYRRKVLLNGVDERLKQIITQASEEYHAVIEDMEVMADHVHLLVIVDPQFGIHRLVKLLKGRSSRFLRQEFPHLKTRMPTLWTNSYFVATVGGAPLELIKQYIEGQKHV